MCTADASFFFFFLIPQCWGIRVSPASSLGSRFHIIGSTSSVRALKGWDEFEAWAGASGAEGDSARPSHRSLEESPCRAVSYNIPSQPRKKRIRSPPSPLRPCQCRNRRLVVLPVASRRHPLRLQMALEPETRRLLQTERGRVASENAAGMLGMREPRPLALSGCAGAGAGVGLETGRGYWLRGMR